MSIYSAKMGYWYKKSQSNDFREPNLNYSQTAYRWSSEYSYPSLRTVEMLPFMKF